MSLTGKKESRVLQRKNIKKNNILKKVYIIQKGSWTTTRHTKKMDEGGFANELKLFYLYFVDQDFTTDNNSALPPRYFSPVLYALRIHECQSFQAAS